jgi:hypothetical protein
LTADDTDVPTAIGNFPIMPTAFFYSDTTWVPLDGDGGILGGMGGPGINLVIPNWIDFEPLKLMWVQITYVGSPTNPPSIVNILSNDNTLATVTVVPAPPVIYPIPLRIGVYGLAQLFTFYPNPDWESFDIVIPSGVVIDQVVVDTISTSIPEPASLAMLALGGLAILSRRHRSIVENKMGHH